MTVSHTTCTRMSVDSIMFKNGFVDFNCFKLKTNCLNEKLSYAYDLTTLWFKERKKKVENLVGFFNIWSKIIYWLPRNTNECFSNWQRYHSWRGKNQFVFLFGLSIHHWPLRTTRYLFVNSTIFDYYTCWKLRSWYKVVCMYVASIPYKKTFFYVIKIVLLFCRCVTTSLIINVKNIDAL